MIKYLSPTTFLKYQNCPYQVKLLKEKEIPEQEQTLPMATGIAFDIMVKCAINRRLKKEELFNIEIKEINKSAILVANEIFEVYSKAPLLSLRSEGIGYVAVDQEIEIEFNGEKSILYGKPDVVLTDGTVIDWKVTGAFSNNYYKPKSGYCRKFYKGKDQGGENEEFTMEQVDKNWATQLYLYARELGHAAIRHLRGGIENILITPTNDIFCVSYRNIISQSFQLECETNFHKAFKALNEGTIETGHPNKFRCWSYKRLCPVSTYCEAFKEWQKMNSR